MPRLFRVVDHIHGFYDTINMINIKIKTVKNPYLNTLAHETLYKPDDITN